MASNVLSSVLLLVSLATAVSATTHQSEAMSGGKGLPPPWAKEPSVRRLLAGTVDGGSWSPAADVVVAQGGGGKGLPPPWAKEPSVRRLLAETVDGAGSSYPPAADVVVVAQGGGSKGVPPPWAKEPSVQRLLAETVDGGSWPPAPDVVVAQGGGGNYKEIIKALEAAPKGESRYVVLVKEGVYHETLNIMRRNVVLLGEGMGKTVITGNLSNATGTDMYLTATVNALGHGFVAQDLTIRNTAGPEGNQALAFRSNSNKSIIYRCSLEGYQDTVYAENNLQLYLGCDLYGTVDFVFGNAKAVFQSCRLLVRRPKTPGAHNVITAQGRNSQSHESGFVFQNCTVQAAEREDLTGVETYLGRPWKNFSHVTFMDCFLDEVVTAAGWVAWKKGEEVEATKRTVSYTEFRNRGPKADTSQRIAWEGFHVLTDAKQAEGYTVDRFIGANLWVPPQIRYNNNI